MKICRDCGVCCHYTEMQLSIKDIQNIEKNNPKNLSRNDFCEIVDGFFQLKNIDDHCIFLDPYQNTCTIYNNRPEGCKFYPMIFDENQNRCILDKDCPYRREFYKHAPNYKSTCKKLRNWIKEELIPSDQRKKKSSFS
ncbi:MAG: YkgJ family cysteine cluster protein [Promethearchaeota archaeon]